MIGCDFSSFQSVRIIIRTHCFLWMFLFKKTDIVLLFVHLVLFCWNWYRHASQRYSNLDEVRHSTSEFKSSSSEKESFVVKGCHRARLKIKQQKKRSWAFFFLYLFSALTSRLEWVCMRGKKTPEVRIFLFVGLYTIVTILSQSDNSERTCLHSRVTREIIMQQQNDCQCDFRWMFWWELYMVAKQAALHSFLFIELFQKCPEKKSWNS